MDHPGPHLIRDPCSPCHPWSLVFESTGETPVLLSGPQAGWNPCTTIRRYALQTAMPVAASAIPSVIC